MIGKPVMWRLNNDKLISFSMYIGETGGQPYSIWKINHFLILDLKVVVARPKNF